MNKQEFSTKWSTQSLWNQRQQNLKALNKQRVDDYYKKLGKLREACK